MAQIWMQILFKVAQFWMPFNTLGMAIALGAIFLSGFGVYGKGLAALRQGRLNINALMAVAAVSYTHLRAHET